MELETEIDTVQLMGLNSEIWKAKKDKNLALNAAVKKAMLPQWCKSIEADLKEWHKIQSIEFAGKTQVEFWILA